MHSVSGGTNTRIIWLKHFWSGYFCGVLLRISKIFDSFKVFSRKIVLVSVFQKYHPETPAQLKYSIRKDTSEWVQLRTFINYLILLQPLSGFIDFILLNLVEIVSQIIQKFNDFLIIFILLIMMFIGNNLQYRYDRTEGHSVSVFVNNSINNDIK